VGEEENILTTSLPKPIRKMDIMQKCEPHTHKNSKEIEVDLKNEINLDNFGEEKEEEEEKVIVDFSLQNSLDEEIMKEEKLMISISSEETSMFTSQYKTYIVELFFFFTQIFDAFKKYKKVGGKLIKFIRSKLQQLLRCFTKNKRLNLFGGIRIQFISIMRIFVLWVLPSTQKALTGFCFFNKKQCQK
jgi:hypothetical protein